MPFPIELDTMKSEMVIRTLHSIPRTHNSVALMLAVQVLVIVGGTLLIAAFRKFWSIGSKIGPDIESWLAKYEFTSSWGWFAVFVPLIWYGIALWELDQSEDKQFSLGFVAATAVATLIIAALYFGFVVEAVNGPGRR